MIAPILVAMSIGLTANNATSTAPAHAQEPVVDASVFFSEEFMAIMRGDEPSNGCSATGDCGKSYQACCLAFKVKGFPCGCHLADGSGTSGSNCGARSLSPAAPDLCHRARPPATDRFLSYSRRYVWH